MQKPLERQIIDAGLWSAVAALGVAVVSLFLPLDAPGGYAADHASRVGWLVENRAVFIVAWVVQIASMATLTIALLALAWQVYTVRAVRGMLGASVLLASFFAFIIPKFIAVWTIPLLAEAANESGAGKQLADTLLLLLNVSVPYSLFTAFDYLGFWLYAIFGLLAAGPLLAGSASSKVCGMALGLYGLLYHVALLSVLAGAVEAPEIEGYAMSVAMLLIIALAAAVFNFKGLAATVD